MQTDSTEICLSTVSLVQRICNKGRLYLLKGGHCFQIQKSGCTTENKRSSGVRISLCFCFDFVMYMFVCVPPRRGVEVRGHLAAVGCLLLPWRPWELNSGHWAWRRQAPSSTEKSGLVLFVLSKESFKKKSLAIHLTIGTFLLSMTTGHFTYNIPFLYDTMFNKEKFGQQGPVIDIFNPSRQEAGACRSLSLGQPGLHSMFQVS